MKEARKLLNEFVEMHGDPARVWWGAGTILELIEMVQADARDEIEAVRAAGRSEGLRSAVDIVRSYYADVNYDATQDIIKVIREQGGGRV